MRNYSVPRASLPLALLAVLIVVGPLVAFVAAIPWAGLPELLGPAQRTAFLLSLGTSLLSTVLCVLLGLPLALWLRLLARRWPSAAGALTLLVLAPLVLSPVLSGLALTFLWGRNGTLGAWLDAAGLPVAFTPAAVVVVQVFVAMPFFVASAGAALRGTDERCEEAAALDGASPSQTLRHVVLPQVMPGLVIGAVLSFARALSEYGATLTFAGNIEGATQTIPLLVALGLSSGDLDRALGASVLLLGVYLLVVTVLVAAWLAARVRQ